MAERSRNRTRRAPFRWPRSSTVAGVLVILIVAGSAVVGVRQLLRDDSEHRPLIAEPLTGLQARPETDSSAWPSATPRTGSTRVRTGAKVKLGVFRSTSRSGVTSFEQWLGRDVDYVVDFSSRSTWNDISTPTYMINEWRNTGYRMVYSVALLPGNGSGSIAAGARGDYDEYYRTLARNLVAGGQEDAILRLGWEFNLEGWRWSTDDYQAFIAYWRHVVTAMRSVPGQQLQFDWNLNVGETAYHAYDYYPGDKYVDYVGVDVYDISWDEKTYPYEADCSADCREDRQSRVWDRLLNGTYGLVYWAEFARSKGKPMSVPEWGLWERPDGHGGGDDPYFITQMHAFVDDPQNRVAYQAYLEVDVADGQHRLTTFTTAGQAYKRLFGP
jgi:hypothetical protein